VLFAAGRNDEGLSKLAEASRQDPGNQALRIALASRRASLVNQLVLSGEAARRDGRLSDSEKAYGQALAYDPNQVMARQGLDAVVAERRHRLVIEEAQTLLKQGTPTALAEAAGKLRTVLAEAPNHRDALSVKGRVEDAQGRLQKPETKLAATYRKPITLEFRDAPLKSVFDLIAKVSGLNFFFDKDIRPDMRATILAKNTSIEDAVHLVLVTNQLEQKILNDNSVLIYPNTPQKLKDYQTLAVRTFFLANADVKAVSNTIKTILKTKDLVIDERLGLIIMRDTPEAIRMAERIVTLQDLSDPEVMLEVEVLEIKRSRLIELGVQWPATLSLTPLQTAGSPLTLSALRHLSRSTIGATVGNTTINANQQDQDVNTLANPRIRVRNKEKAKILIGDRVPIITTTSTSTGFVAESVNYVEVGLKLEVEPNIYMDEEVAIKVNLEVSTLGAQTVSKAGTVTYQIGTRGANTVLRLKNGETQILAGLISDEDRVSANKVPGVGALPIVGRLFGSQNNNKQRSEILLSITPRVMRSIRRPDLLAAEFDSGTESNVGADTLRLSVVEPPVTGKDAPTVPATAAGLVAGVPGQPLLKSVVPITATAAAGSSAATPMVSSPSTKLSWQLPAQVRQGEQFSAVLSLASQEPVKGMPLLIGFDPQLFQVVSVTEGDFLRQGNGRTQFNHRVDPAQGKVFVAAVRQSGSGSDTGVNGSGSLVTVTFKALKPAGAAKLQLLSATPEPASASPVSLPLEANLRIAQ